MDDNQPAPVPPRSTYPEYLGDGVYATFDGWHIRLHVGSHESPSVVALEPEVLEALNKYNQRLNRIEEDED